MHEATHHMPEALLSEVDEVRRRSRSIAHRGAWFPAAMLAALSLASMMLYARPFGLRASFSFSYPYWAGLPDTQRNDVASRVFWFAGLPLAFALIGLWYRRRANRAGVRVNWLPLAITGVTVLALVALILAIPEHRLGPAPGVTWVQNHYWGGLLTPLLPVGFAVIVLGRIERSRALIAAGVWFSLCTYFSCLYGLGNVYGGTNDLLAQSGISLSLITTPLVIVTLVKSGAAARSARRAR